MSRGNTIAIIGVVVVLVALLMCSYTVRENEQVVILAFGEVVGDTITEPGLHFKVPWYEARKFDKRWLAWDGDPNQITTLDKRYIRIDVFARWRIVDPLVFIEKLRDEQSAQGRLDDILDSATRNVIANHNLIEAIRSTDRDFVISEEEKENLINAFTDLPPAEERKVLDSDSVDAGVDSDSGLATAEAAEMDSDTAMDTASDTVAPTTSEPAPTAVASAPATAEEIASGDDPDEESIYDIEVGRQRLTQFIMEKASEKTMELGIELRDVRLKRIDYIESVQRSVFERMVSERQKVAARLRSQGDGLSAEILGRKERDLKQIRSEAYRTAEEIKGRADAQAARIYAEAYKRDPELYQFLKTLESYQQTIGQKTWLLITTESDYGSYFKRAQ